MGNVFIPPEGPPVTFFCCFKGFIYLFDTERDQKLAERQAEREGEAGSLLSREPDAGLNPRTLRSCPEPKSGVNPLSHPGASDACHS